MKRCWQMPPARCSIWHASKKATRHAIRHCLRAASRSCLDRRLDNSPALSKKEPPMLEQSLDCLVSSADRVRPLHAIRPTELATFFDHLPPAQSSFLRQLGFTAAAQEL